MAAAAYVDLEVAGGDCRRVGGAISNLQQHRAGAWLDDLDVYLVSIMARFAVVYGPANKGNRDRLLRVATDTHHSAVAVEVNDVDRHFPRWIRHARAVVNDNMLSLEMNPRSMV